VHARYENMLAFPIVLISLALFGKFTYSELKKHPYLYSFSLLFLIPRIWQLMTPQNFENPVGVPVLGLSNFLKHLPIFLRNLINFEFELPYATILNVLALGIALLWSVFFLWKRTAWVSKQYFPFVLVILGFAFSELTITLSHHFGVFDHPTQARLFLLFIVTLSLSPFLLYWVMGRLPSKTLLLGSVCFFLLYFPIAQENRFVNKLTIIRKTRWTYDFFDKLDNRNILIIADRPGIYTIRQTGAVDFNWALANQKIIRDDLTRHLYDAVYVVEDIEYKKNTSQLDAIFKQVTLFERQNTPELYVRISKVVL
jgi:hypothetical protein